MQGVLGGTHPAPAGEAGRRLALPGGSSGSKGVESSWMAAEQEECGHGDRRPTSSCGQPPPTHRTMGEQPGLPVWGQGPAVLGSG